MPSIFDHLPVPAVKIPEPKPDRRPRVLVVDDQPVNLKLLERKLERDGIEPLLAGDGVECLRIARSERPDLILLDVMMPEMDGLEACRLLNSYPETRDIPVIFITARSLKEDKLVGLGAGAVDYIVKPIDLDETVARVRTQLRMREFHRENLALQARLADARRQAVIGRLTLGLSHNLNNLLGIVVGYTDLMHSAPGNEALVRRSLEGTNKGLRRIGAIISQVLLLGEHARPTLSYASLSKVVDGAIENFRAETEGEVVISVDLGNVSELKFLTNAETLKMVFARLLTNGMESAGRRGATPPVLKVIASESGLGDYRRVCIRIEDNGEGVDPTVSESIFDPFISVKADVGAGLGLPLARHALGLLDGTLELENLASGVGAAAVIQLPVTPPSSSLPPPPLPPPPL